MITGIGQKKMNMENVGTRHLDAGLFRAVLIKIDITKWKWN